MGREARRAEPWSLHGTGRTPADQLCSAALGCKYETIEEVVLSLMTNAECFT